MSIPKAIIHLDMDAFYASVEQRDAPHLRGKPVIVGGHAQRGVVLAASYEVRPFGVRSAMPMAWAVEKAPHAIVVPPRFEAYVEASEAVFRILESYTPLIEPLSLDEAFMDVGASVGLKGSPAHMATEMRARIRRELDLPASTGIAAVKFVAKMASDAAKPNGQCEVAAQDTVRFLAPLPVNRLWGVGPKMEERLHALGLRLIGDIAARDGAWMAAQLGPAGTHFWELAHGRDERSVVPDRDAKSIGAEDTFAQDIQRVEDLLPHIHAQALRVGRRLRRAGVKTRVVQLKLKDNRFEATTRRTTLDPATDDGQVLFQHAKEMLEREPPGRPIRLTGVSAQDLRTGGQLDLFGKPQLRNTRLNSALDAIANKFGADAVTTADVAGHVRQGPADVLRERAGASTLDVAPGPMEKPRRGR